MGQKQPIAVQLIQIQQISSKTIEHWPVKQEMVQASNHPKMQIEMERKVQEMGQKWQRKNIWDEAK